MAITASPIGIFGGTFDPIHFGHLRLALEVWQSLKLDHLRFVPCKQPALKSMPRASEAQRLQMLNIALTGHKQFIIDQRELSRPGVSYTIDTLQSLRDEFPDSPLCFIMGSDVFASFDQWHRWRELLALAHIVVVHRPHFAFKFSTVIEDLLAKHHAASVAALHNQVAGRIFLQEITALDISASHIRDEVQQGLIPAFLSPDLVVDYMGVNKIYGYK